MQKNTTSARGYNPVPSSGNCVYDCTYSASGSTNLTYCGSTTNAWNGYKPGTVTCPSNSN
jgi:hypothetical protein